MKNQVELARQARALKRQLRTLSNTVGGFIGAVDSLMKKPWSEERDKKLAKYLNQLDIFNDSARYSFLDVNFRTDRKEDYLTLAEELLAVRSELAAIKGNANAPHP